MYSDNFLEQYVSAAFKKELFEGSIGKKTDSECSEEKAKIEKKKGEIETWERKKSVKSRNFPCGHCNGK